MKSKKFKLIFGFIAIAAILEFLYDFINFSIIKFPEEKLHNFSDNINAKNMDDKETEYLKLACKFARPNPWDPEILDQINHPRQIECDQDQQPSFLTYVHYNGSVLLNRTAFELMPNFQADQIDQINCTLEFIDRDPTQGNDRITTFVFRSTLNFDQPVDMKTDTVIVRCMDLNMVEVYSNIHAHPVPKNKTFQKKDDPKETDQLSVLMFILDSVSKSVLIRHLPKTYKFIKDVMHFKIFDGFSKVGDNTRPNMVAALTGLRCQQEQENMKADINEDYEKINFDHWPLIWKFYSQKGYTTVFNEEKAKWGLFHYLSRGFKDKPVDFYYHTYWHAIDRQDDSDEKQENQTLFKSHCFRGVSRVERLLDLAKRHIVTMNNILQFQYVFLTDLSHEYDGSEIERADDFLVDFFQKLYNPSKTDLLNNTVILFMGDHGHRFTPIRKTLVGLIEERTPMFNIWFPKWFHKKYPQISKNLNLNSVRLSSPFDVYETLKDLANSNFNGDQKPMGSRGYSQLYEIPPNRTCYEAGIPDHHCTCISMKPIDNLNNNPQLQLVAKTVVDHLNSKLEPYSKLCSKFRLQRILRAEQLYVNEKLANGITHYEEKNESTTLIQNDTLHLAIKVADQTELLHSVKTVRIAIQVEPVRAEFEATCFYNETEQKYILSNSDISRLNQYGHQSDCVEKSSLKKICVCHDYLQNSDRIK